MKVNLLVVRTIIFYLFILALGHKTKKEDHLYSVFEKKKKKVVPEPNIC